MRVTLQQIEPLLTYGELEVLRSSRPVMPKAFELRYIISNLGLNTTVKLLPLCLSAEDKIELRKLAIQIMYSCTLRWLTVAHQRALNAGIITPKKLAPESSTCKIDKLVNYLVDPGAEFSFEHFVTALTQLVYAKTLEDLRIDEYVYSSQAYFSSLQAEEAYLNVRSFIKDELYLFAGRNSQFGV